ncbi:LOW QUALITY PROTEIN: hypothetical protein V2J09_018024 [Rumex salicifolius]
MALRNDAGTPFISPEHDPTEEGSSSTARNWYQLWRISPINRTNQDDHPLDGSSLNPDFKFSDKPNNLHIFLVLFIYLGGGTLCFYLVRTQINGKHTNGIVDALYFCIVTMTTLGYGDLVPSTILSKLLACLYVFIGMAIVGNFLSKVADYFVEKQEIALAKALDLQDKLTPSEILNEVVTQKTKYKFLLCLGFLVLLMISGVLVLTLVEKMSIINAVYCVCATITTLGYGDESFSTEGGRIFAIFWILSSTICLAQFFFYLTEIYTERRQRSLLKWVLGRKLTLKDIQASDIDKDNVVSAAELILYKLKEMEKIKEEDIAPLMECFNSLDVDRSGTLTAADIFLALDELYTNGIIFLVLLVISGDSVLTLVEKMNLMKAFYCASVSPLFVPEILFSRRLNLCHLLDTEHLSSNNCLAHFFFHLTEMYS